ncbi:MAG: hypothetical protein BGO70_03110 [Bacteroidetes bacterium 43-93]|nr:hypothetical protein [Bacteroidota bacterium]OJW95767.1 MAG: hypothetical protein BGO70_03110 [Bacteroidetes bacterium 43-93]
MSTLEFDELFETLKDGVSSIAKETIGKYAEQATAEGQKALKTLKGDLKSWTEDAKNGDLSAADLDFLLKGREELTEMHALEQLGIAKIQLDKFKNGIIGLIVNSVTGLL